MGIASKEVVFMMKPKGSVVVEVVGQAENILNREHRKCRVGGLEWE